MSRELELAMAVREMCKNDGRRGSDWDMVDYLKSREKACGLVAQILDSPQQESATVAFPGATVQRILLVAKALEDGLPHSLLVPGAFRNWANELEKEQSLVDELRELNRVAFKRALGLQDELSALAGELADVKRMVAYHERERHAETVQLVAMVNQRNELESRIAELESRQPESKEVSGGD